jgi:hypothetical protein
MKLTGENRQLREKPVPVPLCPPQISHGLTRNRTRTSAVRGRRLTAWAMARPPQDRLLLVLTVLLKVVLVSCPILFRGGPYDWLIRRIQPSEGYGCIRGAQSQRSIKHFSVSLVLTILLALKPVLCYCGPCIQYGYPHHISGDQGIQSLIPFYWTI